jgi:hypothetical protein
VVDEHGVRAGLAILYIREFRERLDMLLLEERARGTFVNCAYVSFLSTLKREKTMSTSVSVHFLSMTLQSLQSLAKREESIMGSFIASIWGFDRPGG